MADSFLPGSGWALHGTGQSELTRLSWLRSGTAKWRWELLWGEDQLRAVSCKHQYAASPVWVSWAISAQNFVVSCTYGICPNRNTLLQEYNINPNTYLFRKTKIIALHLKKIAWTPIFLHYLQILSTAEQEDNRHIRMRRINTECMWEKERGELHVSHTSKENEDIT